MKDGLENSFKKALNEFELPYDAQAWESLSKKMNAKKWYQLSSVKWSAALLVVLGISSYFIFENNKTTKTKETQSKSSIKSTNPTLSQTNNQKNVVNESTILHSSTTIKTEYIDSESISPMIDFITEMIPHSIPLITENETIGTIDPEIGNQDLTPSYNGNAVMFDFKNRCQGETFQLEGSRYNQCIVLYAGKQFEYKYNEAINLKLSEAGKVELIANKGPYGQFESIGSFEVYPSPTLSLAVDRNINYEDGLPKINLTADASVAQLNWVSNLKLDSYQGKTSTVLAFEKGFAIVEVQATAANGCKSNEKEMISIAEDYNLLAVNAFNPQSLDSRNSTFMPFALTIRQTPFKLIILDPDNGGVVFQSSDASNAWDGIDRRDGKMVPSNKAYIWKVVLQNPVAGEKGEYRGTIVRM